MTSLVKEIPQEIWIHQIFAFLDLSTIQNLCTLKAIGLSYDLVLPLLQVLHSLYPSFALPHISFKNAQVVSFPNNQITSLDPLSNCTALTRLDLSCNKQITSLGPLSKCKDNLRKGYLKIGNIDLTPF